jgi:HK97 gp10 family phage protein
VIDLESLGQSIFEAAVQGLGQGAKRVAVVARQKAPVRHIFAGHNYGIRHKSIDEIEGEREVRDRALRTGSPRATVVQPGDVPGVWLRKAIGKKPPVHWRERRLSAAQQLLDQYDAEMSRRRVKGYVGQKTVLDRKGAYEVRTMRAQFTTWGHAAIGGRLRGSISARPALAGTTTAEAWVIATAPYAKFQEFGTRHNAAHPFLRPAAMESRNDVVRLVADAVREASRTGSSSTEIEIVVRI